MSTRCYKDESHPAHEWRIGDDPFWCDGDDSRGMEFPTGVSFYRAQDLEVWLRWPDAEGGLNIQSLQAWMDDNCPPGVDADVIEELSGAILAVTLTGPSTYVTGGGALARRFRLVRHTDVSGISGTGVVCHGVEFPDGTVVLRWCAPGRPSSTVVWASIDAVEEIHGHDGATEIEWID